MGGRFPNAQGPTAEDIRGVIGSLMNKIRPAMENRAVSNLVRMIEATTRGYVNNVQDPGARGAPEDKAFIVYASLTMALAHTCVAIEEAGILKETSSAEELMAGVCRDTRLLVKAARGDRTDGFNPNPVAPF